VLPHFRKHVYEGHKQHLVAYVLDITFNLLAQYNSEKDTSI